MNTPYCPSQLIIDNYAKVIVESARVEKGHRVYVTGQESSKPLFRAILEEIIRRGGSVIPGYRMDDTRDGYSNFFLKNASDEQLASSPQKYYASILDECQRQIIIHSFPDMEPTKGVDARKITAHEKSFSSFAKKKLELVSKGRFHYTICIYPTQALADAAGMSLEEYWKYMSAACNLNDPDPVASLRDLRGKIWTDRDWLNSLNLKSIRIKGPNADLYVRIGENRQWIAMSGRNFPSFEFFLSPDKRFTKGWIKYSTPIWYEGKEIRGAMLAFEGEDGGVTSFSADTNQDVLAAIINAGPNARYLGEVSMTPEGLSPFVRYMACTMLDENAGGTDGIAGCNIHTALGMGYPFTLTMDSTSMTREEFERVGLNQCYEVHQDMITTDRKNIVEGELQDGTVITLLKDGRFVKN